MTPPDINFRGKRADATTRFSSRVRAYQSTRPAYPSPLLDWIHANFGLCRGQVVADVGAGTGIFTLQLLGFEASVVAVEPNAPMRGALEARTAVEQRGGTLRVCDGAAEGTGLMDASVDGVVAAQAFHWFDPVAFAAECRRILRPGGWAAMVWNNRRSTGTPFARAYEGFIKRWEVDYARVGASYANLDDLGRLFESVPEPQRFEHAQTLDRGGLLGRLQSSSYMPGATHPDFGSMCDAAGQLFEAHAQSGRVELAYETVVYGARLPAGVSTSGDR